MGVLVIPKTWSPGDVPAAADLNAVFAAIVASANAIGNAQIAPNAAIDGSKVAALTTANYEDGSFSGTKLAPGATTVSQSVSEATGQSTAITGTEAVVASRTQARAGGGMLLFGFVIVEIEGSGGVDEVRVRLLEDAAPLGVEQKARVVLPVGWTQSIQLAVTRTLAPAVAGSVTWDLGVTRTVGTTTITATGWELVAWELR